MNRALAFASTIAVACAETPESEVLVPDQVQVVWDDAYNAVGDGLGALVPVDVMVYDSVTGQPQPWLDVAVWTEHSGARPVPMEGVATAEVDAVGSEARPFDPGAAGPRPAALWDALHDRFVQVEAEDELQLVTDRGGVARLYVLVDAFPGGPGALRPVEVVVQAGRDGDTALAEFSIVPR